MLSKLVSSSLPSGTSSDTNLIFNFINFITIFENIFIPPAPGDAGGAIGSALVVLERNQKFLELKNFKNPYLGKSYSNDEIYRFIETKINGYFECFG